MDWYQRTRATVISTIVRDTPRSFWLDVRTQARHAYADTFEQVRNEPTALDEQRLDKLYQDRHFRMEHLLSNVAREHGFACSTTILTANNRCYVYATRGSIGLTQAYVPTIGAMPKPARFRERHAALNNIPNVPRLDLGDEPPEVLLGKDFYGLLAHNPAGKRFVADDQRLGMIQFCVPIQGMLDWAAELSIEEIVAAYDSMAPAQKADRALPWKQPRRDEKEEKG